MKKTFFFALTSELHICVDQEGLIWFVFTARVGLKLTFQALALRLR